MSVVFKKPQDLQIIKSILQKNSLPYQDVETGKIDFFLAYEDESFIGIVGLEKFGDIGLLRSMQGY